jgi:membrane-associated phospholipid phosphatase
LEATTLQSILSLALFPAAILVPAPVLACGGEDGPAPVGTTPTITAFNPVSGSVGFSVALTGTHFTGVRAVKFNGTVVSGFSSFDNQPGGARGVSEKRQSHSLRAPSWKTLQEATWKAARHPGTWIPLIGAGIVAAGGWDPEISRWARDTTPVFGSKGGAQDASDSFRAAAHLAMILSALAVRRQETYWIPMLERVAMQQVGVDAIAQLNRHLIADGLPRDRPEGGNDSFPSGHATQAFAYAAMAYQNIDCLDLPNHYRVFAITLTGLSASATAWARVEAGRHYPTDVLVGAALGNFLAILINQTFSRDGMSISAGSGEPGGFFVACRFHW